MGEIESPRQTVKKSPGIGVPRTGAVDHITHGPQEKPLMRTPTLRRPTMFPQSSKPSAN